MIRLTIDGTYVHLWQKYTGSRSVAVSMIVVSGVPWRSLLEEPRNAKLETYTNEVKRHLS